MVRRTKQAAQTTRASLLDAAEKIFSEHGTSGATLQQIANAAGVTRGALYHHFKNKTDLLEALMQRVMLPMEEMRATTLTEDPLTQIKMRATHILRQAVHDPHTRAVFNILLHKCEYVDAVLPVKQRQLCGRDHCLDEVTAIFKAAISKRQLPKHADPRRAAIALFALVDGLVYNWLLEPDLFDLETDADYYIDSYIAGLMHFTPKKTQTVRRNKKANFAASKKPV